jgi:hypothetical protein
LTNATAGTANTGGGGGGGSGANSSAYVAAAGGKGVVIVRYLTADATRNYASITGGTKTTSGDYTIHTFNDTGSLVIA